MQDKTIELEDVTLHLKKEKTYWQLNIPKSQANVRDVRQMDLLKEPNDHFAPFHVEEKEDTFLFGFTVEKHWRNWEKIYKLPTNEKLRLLNNTGKLDRYLSTRITFSLHPELILYDENLMPVVTYRGLRNLVPPFEMEEEVFLKQFKCFIIALFSKKYTYEQLYHGSLRKVEETEFQRQVRDMEDLDQLKAYLQETYMKEQEKTEQTMSIVPLKRFRLFKQLSIIMVVVSVLLAAPLAYFAFVQIPFQDNLLEAHGEYLSSDYGEVISTLRGEDPENLPFRTQYILADSYIKVEPLSDSDREVVLRNVSLRSDPDYLLYWIYNGRGEFDESMEKAKYIDDAQLIMYGLIQQIEEARNNPDLTGEERDERLNALNDELASYRDDYNLNESEEAAGEVHEPEGAGAGIEIEEEDEEVEEVEEEDEDSTEEEDEDTDDDDEDD
ncbi:type VII secretion protein EssB [Virgibacillus kimchii]